MAVCVPVIVSFRVQVIQYNGRFQDFILCLIVQNYTFWCADESASHYQGYGARGGGEYALCCQSPSPPRNSSHNSNTKSLHN